MHEQVFAEYEFAPAIADAITDYQTERGKPMPNFTHGTIQSQITHLLKSRYSKEFSIVSELSLATDPPTTPDVCIYPKRKVDMRTDAAKTSEMPLTAIEILSPSQVIEIPQDKAWDIYFPAGVRSVWVVVPELKVIQVLLPNGDRHIFYKNTLTDPATGIQINVEQVFEDIL